MAYLHIDSNLIPFFPQVIQDMFRSWQGNAPGRLFEDFYDEFWGNEYENKKEDYLKAAKLAYQNKLDTETEKRSQASMGEQMNKSRLARQKTYTSFSGADMVASIRTAGGKPIIFGEVQTISYSIYRPMMPVTTLGRINPTGVVRGPRTIAGTMIFTVFDRHVLRNVMDQYATQTDSFRTTYGMDEAAIKDLRQYAKTDEMPPFDVNISFLNEYGNSATLNIYAIHIMSEGQTMSIEDMITENTMQYIAMDIDLMDYGANATTYGGKL
jgi:hypothetical protein